MEPTDVKLNVYLSEEQHRSLKIYCAEHGLTIRAAVPLLIEKAITPTAKRKTK